MHNPFLLHPLFNLAFDPVYGPTSNHTTTSCPFLGQVYPPPTAISESSIWQDVTTDLTRALADDPALRLNTTSYGIQISSLHETSPLYEHYGKSPYHFYGHDKSNPVTGGTMFRIASVSKLFTVYALLLNCGFGCFEDPITKYIPELAYRDVDDHVEQVDWEDVTVGALASQISGIGRDYTAGDLSINPFFNPGSRFGLPDLEDIDPSDIPTCGGPLNERKCSREEAIRMIRRAQPVFPTWYGPAYSNDAFQLIGYVLQNISGQSYNQTITESIFNPLRMTQSSVTVPPGLTNVVILPGDPMAGYDFAQDTPSGGIYMSTNDLTRHARAVMNYTQLSASQTRRWLKPYSHFSDQLSLGPPWEIHHVPGLALNHDIYLYTKSGSLTTYTTIYGIIPDLQIAITINALTGDPMGGNAGVLTNLVASHVIKPLYDIAKSQAEEKFSGTYIDPRPGHNSSLTVSTDEGVGLVMTEWISNGTDALGVFKELGVTTQEVRLYPTTLSSTTKDGVEKLAFRGTLLSPGGGCVSWVTVDGLKWAGRALDAFVFEVDLDNPGRAAALRIPALRITLYREDAREMLQVQEL